MIPDGSTLPAETDLRIAREGEEERPGQINAKTCLVGGAATSFLSHLNTAIHEDPDDVTQAPRRVDVLRWCRVGMTNSWRSQLDSGSDQFRGSRARRESR